jgi:Family of unknown function (DUF6786)
VPLALDWGAWEVRASDRQSIELAKHVELTNRAGTGLAVDVVRRVAMLDDAGVRDVLGVAIPDGVHAVGFESDNRITNAGPAPWEKSTGLVSSVGIDAIEAAFP